MPGVSHNVSTMSPLQIPSEGIDLISSAVIALKDPKTFYTLVQ